MAQHKVFLSRKDSDKDAVAKIGKEMGVYATEVDFVSQDDLPAGVDWHDWLRDQLASSHLLIVFTTAPSDDWDWLLYEAGWFTRLEPDDELPLVCMHTSDNPPDPLKHYQSVHIDVASVKGFLKSLYGESELKGMEDEINRVIADDDEKLTELAVKICDAMGQAVGSKLPSGQLVYNRFVELTYEPGETDESSIPRDATVRSDKSSLTIFGLQSKTKPDGSAWIWGDLVDRVLEAEELRSVEHGTPEEYLTPQWLRDVEQGVANAVRGQMVDPVSGLLASVADARMYRPNVSRVDTFEDGKKMVKLLFIHQPALVVPDQPPEMDLTEPVERSIAR